MKGGGGGGCETELPVFIASNNNKQTNE